MDLLRFRELPLVGIIRGVTMDTLDGTLQAAVDGGLKTIEITLNTPNALKLIKTATTCSFTVGAGTVCTCDEAKAAVQAGAAFIVSPITDVSMITWCKKENIPIFAGALTPTEVYRAWEAGATMVKVFPVDSMGGPAYIKKLKGPLDNIDLLACSGVRPENLGDYFSAGASAVAIGGSIFKQEWIANGEYHKIKDAINKYMMQL